MKLYEIWITNNLEYEDYDYRSQLIVANSQAEADIRAKQWMVSNYGTLKRNGKYDSSFGAEEITEVDGFKVTVSR